VRFAAPRDQEALAVAGAFHVPAAAIAEFVDSER
jgi:hypothetical protein